jgi:hypothetical protein
VQPDPTKLIRAVGLTTPLVGFYDAPDPTAFTPALTPARDRRACVFAFYRHWLEGTYLHLTRESFGCGGAGRCLFGVLTRTRDEYIRFLADEEGLKASRELMAEWLDAGRPYRPQHPHLFFGPLRAEQYACLKTVPFYVRPDQLGVLMTGVQYHSAPGDPPPVVAPFGSGCMQMGPCFADLEIAQALVGATDVAMRGYLPPDVLAFTATKPMFERLCSLDERSILFKPFWTDLQRERGAAG